MACACGKNRANRQRYEVVLPGGMKVTKNSQSEAAAFAARHPGAVIKPAA